MAAEKGWSRTLQMLAAAGIDANSCDDESDVVNRVQWEDAPNTPQKPQTSIDVDLQRRFDELIPLRARRGESSSDTAGLSPSPADDSLYLHAPQSARPQEFAPS